MGRLFALAVGFCLAACADEPWEWYAPGNTAMPHQQAAYECERDTRMAARSFGYGIAAQMEAMSFAIRCMNSKGYYQRSLRAAGSGSPVPEVAGVPVQVNAFPAGADVEQWRNGWRDCGGRHIAATEIERCAGPPPASAVAAATELRVRHQIWERRFKACETKESNPSARYTCAGAPPS